MNVGHAVPGIVTIKPISVGGSRGQKFATGRGVMIIVRGSSGRAKGVNRSLEHSSNQGFGNAGSAATLLLHEAG